MFADGEVSRPNLGELRKVLERMLQANSPDQVRSGTSYPSPAGRRPRIPSRGSVCQLAGLSYQSCSDDWVWALMYCQLPNVFRASSSAG